MEIILTLYSTKQVLGTPRVPRLHFENQVQYCATKINKCLPRSLPRQDLELWHSWLVRGKQPRISLDPVTRETGMPSLISCQVAKPGFTEEGGSRDTKIKCFLKQWVLNFTEIRGIGERKDWVVLGFYTGRRSQTSKIPLLKNTSHRNKHCGHPWWHSG